MENATKALLIAAAVLIAVLLISLVMGVLNSGAEQIDNADLSEYEIQQFNDKFNKYVSTNASGSEVNAMLKAVFYHNNAQEDAGTRVEVIDNTSNNADIGTTATTTTSAVPTVSTGARYSVTATYEDGLIKTLTIADI